MKPFRFFGLILTLALLITLGEGASVSARPGRAVPATTHGDVAVMAVAGDTIQAASCSQANVQAAIDAASDGDTVLVPAGNCTWTTLASNEPSVTIYQKGITLKGAGIDQTVITDGTTTSWNETPLRIDGVEGKPFRVTGFTFVGSGLNDSVATIFVKGNCKSWRIDHIRFTENKRSVVTSGFTYGVIDHCVFDNYVYDAQSIQASVADESWQEPLELGTARAVYIEDCLFECGVFCSAMDALIGGRYVFRHNTLSGTYIEAHGFSSGLTSGTFSYEIYGNAITDLDNRYSPVSLRGGTGVVFGNTVSTVSEYYGFPYIKVYNDRSCPMFPWNGLCDGSSEIDGNEDPSGYPCRDQIGRSTDQTLEPLYEWNNTYDGANVDIVPNPGWCITNTLHIQENRDFYNDSASFDGTSGVGVGLKSARPATCTPHVAYWATDENRLYQCTATDTWSLHYVPYTYPHPLTRELDLHGSPADRAIHLTWDVNVTLPPTTTWHMDYYTTTASAPFTATDPFSTTRAYTLTDHVTNYEWYTVTLHAVVGSTSWLSDTVRVMPTNRFVHLPLVLQ